MGGDPPEAALGSPSQPTFRFSYAEGFAHHTQLGEDRAQLGIPNYHEGLLIGLIS